MIFLLEEVIKMECDKSDKGEKYDKMDMSVIISNARRESPGGS